MRYSIEKVVVFFSEDAPDSVLPKISDAITRTEMRFDPPKILSDTGFNSGMREIGQAAYDATNVSGRLEDYAYGIVMLVRAFGYVEEAYRVTDGQAS